MSEIKVDQLSPRTASGTITLGSSGDSLTIPSGVTLTNNGTASGFDSLITPARISASGSSSVEFTSLPSGVNVIFLSSYALSADDNSTIRIQIGT